MPCNSRTAGITLRAKSSASAFKIGMAITLPAIGFGLPSLTPRALTACSAAVVRSEIITDSCWATAARMCAVNSVRCGLSTATHFIPDSMKVAIAATLRYRRSILAISRVAFCALHKASASFSCGRRAAALRVPDSTSVNSAIRSH